MLFECYGLYLGLWSLLGLPLSPFSFFAAAVKDNSGFSASYSKNYVAILDSSPLHPGSVQNIAKDFM